MIHICPGSPRPNKEWWMVFRMIHVKDPLLPLGKVWSLDFLSIYTDNQCISLQRWFIRYIDRIPGGSQDFVDLYRFGRNSMRSARYFGSLFCQEQHPAYVELALSSASVAASELHEKSGISVESYCSWCFSPTYRKELYKRTCTSIRYLHQYGTILSPETSTSAIYSK